MFVSFDEGWPPPPRWVPPPPARPKLTGRQERVLAWLIGVNLVTLLVAPIAGASVVHAVIALSGG